VLCQKFPDITLEIPLLINGKFFADKRYSIKGLRVEKSIKEKERKDGWMESSISNQKNATKTHLESSRSSRSG
jgi:hypothetical protein